MSFKQPTTDEDWKEVKRRLSVVITYLKEIEESYNKPEHPMPDLITTTGKYTSRKGYPARIYATDHAGTWPVSGAIFHDGAWHKYSWTELGQIHSQPARISPEDLIPVPEKIRIKGWMNIFGCDAPALFLTGNIYATKEEAEIRKVMGYLATIEIDQEVEVRKVHYFSTGSMDGDQS